MRYNRIDINAVGERRRKDDFERLEGVRVVSIGRLVDIKNDTVC